MKEIASIVCDLLKEAKPGIQIQDEKQGRRPAPRPTLTRRLCTGPRSGWRELLKGFPLYPELVID